MDEGAAEDMVVEEEQPEDEDENEDVEGREFENEGEGEDEDVGEDVGEGEGEGDTMQDEPKDPDMVANLNCDLVRLYAARMTTLRPTCPPDDERHSKFAASFPFTPTQDQIKTFAEVADDMISKPLPMDRFVYGEVGCGKTEVALRAIHRAWCAGRQVVVLVPTTVLAAQWLSVLDARMPKEMNRALLSSQDKLAATGRKELHAEIAAGKVDVLVGTHKVLSAELQFARLGLLVVDEEQKFGVRHKEVLLTMDTTSLDVLTLSATPLPRTMHMCRVGIRAVSKLSMAPVGRLPTETHVVERDWDVIKGAIEAELDRGGQVLLVVPRIQGMVDETAPRYSGRWFGSARLIPASKSAGPRLTRSGGARSTCSWPPRGWRMASTSRT